jgi:hypothetical protein
MGEIALELARISILSLPFTGFVILGKLLRK